MVGDQDDGTAFAEWTRECGNKMLGCVHVDSCERVVQQDTLKNLSCTLAKQTEFGLQMHASTMPLPVQSSPFARRRV